MYEDTIYIDLPTTNGKYNILQLFIRMNLQKTILILQINISLYMLLHTLEFVSWVTNQIMTIVTIWLFF
jgi:hypothetical protein